MTEQTKVWIVSDTHFGHTNIIKYENRPFWKKILGLNTTEPDVHLMDETLIKNWNDVVGKGDKVFHLGDFSLVPKEPTKHILSRLNGYKILIMGNHDMRHSANWWKEAGFDEVSKYSIIYNQFYILSHRPIYLNENMPYINIHGHTHKIKQELTNEKGNPSYINVCVENTDYKPLLFAEITKQWEEQDSSEL